VGARQPASRLAAALGYSLLLHIAVLTQLQAPKRPELALTAPLSVLLIPLQPAVAPLERPAAPAEEGKRPRPRQPPAPSQAAVPPRAEPVPAPPGEDRLPRISAIPVGTPQFMPPPGVVPSVGALPSGKLRLPSLAAPLDGRYPVRARLAREKATVVFQLLIDEAGRVEEARSLTLAEEDFVEAAAVALRRASFKPGEIDGRPVRTRAYFAVVFELE
jgi:TonB family protein